MVLGTYYLTYGPHGEELEKLEADDQGRQGEEASARLPQRAGGRTLLRARRRQACRTSPSTAVRVPTSTSSPPSVESSSTRRSSVRSKRRLGDDFDPKDYEFVNQSMRKKDINAVIGKLIHAHGASAIAIVLDAFKDLGFKYATRAGITVSQERHRRSAGQAGDPRQVRRRRSPRSATSTTWV